MQFKDYYAVLGVAHDAPADEIRKAFRKLQEVIDQLRIEVRNGLR